MLSRLRISLVIPAYNEESYLVACLRSALAQRQPFHEIIVVDNNSSDDTAATVAQFPTVTLLCEPIQGVVHARDRGFDAASGDIIARIDADTRLPSDWTECMERAFQTTSAAAITGKVTYYDTAWAQSLSISDGLIRRGVAAVLGRNMALQGANMALHQSAWQNIRQHTCSKAGVHEDFDLAIHLVEHDQLVRYEPALQAAVAFRQATSSWPTFASYYWHCPKTYLEHGIRRGYWLLPVSFSMIAAFPLLHVLSKGYNPQTGHFSFSRVFAGQLSRVNPATFVD